MQRVWSTYLDEAFGHVRGKLSRADNRHMDSGSRPASIGSNAPSTRNLLAPSNNASALSLQPSTTGLALLTIPASERADLSLTLNYVPSKFSGALITNDVGPRRRKGKGPGRLEMLPKLGGGIDAFKSGEQRMGGEDDLGGGPRQMRWTRFKWILFVANIFLTIYSLVSLVFCLLTWFNVWAHADIVRTANKPELVTSTIAASVGILTSLIGWSGILLNNRAFLAWYCLLTWITFAFLVIPGYITYRRRTFNLEGKLNQVWSRNLGIEGRSRIQTELQCCGYFSPFVEAAISSTCYARSILPGCKAHFLSFERLVLGRWFKVAFSIVPVHLFVMISALLCSNHVTYRFGKGMMPPAYRLTVGDMVIIMDQYAKQLSEQYGQDVAQQILNRSRANLNLPSGASTTSLNRLK